MKNKLMLNYIQQKSKNTEKISLPKCLSYVAGVGNNGILSKIISGTPNRQLLAFFMPKWYQLPCKQSNIHALNISNFGYIFVMVWLILQNKPIGEYVKRLLIMPRVRPHRPIAVFPLTQKLLGGYHA